MAIVRRIKGIKGITSLMYKELSNIERKRVLQLTRAHGKTLDEAVREVYATVYPDRPANIR